MLSLSSEESIYIVFGCTLALGKVSTQERWKSVVVITDPLTTEFSNKRHLPLYFLVVVVFLTGLLVSWHCRTYLCYVPLRFVLFLASLLQINRPANSFAESNNHQQYLVNSCLYYNMNTNRRTSSLPISTRSFCIL